MNQAYKLIDKRIGIFPLQILGQLQLYGHPSLIIAQVPDTFSQNSINHRPYLKFFRTPSRLGHLQASSDGPRCSVVSS